jgi:acetylornithine deacetylase/succinyl-diaminopimelate desuccinylase-like protein
MNVTDRESQQVVEFVKQRASSEEYVGYCRDLLVEMLAIDTSIQGDVARLRQNEDRVFQIAERELKGILGNRAKINREPINPKIQKDPYYSGLYYTCTPDRKQPLSCEETYKGRYNLVTTIEADAPAGSARNALYNAHIDTVAPYLPPRIDGPLVYGRGSCDDKGEVVLLIAQLKILEEARQKFGLKFGGTRVYQFVIEEEMGGNGSLSLATDERYKGYEAIIHEITGNLPHPANRGCVWYQCALRSAGVAGVKTVEMWPFVIWQLEIEGAKIKAEGKHPLFKPEHIQTNHGILGVYGKHPSAVNDHVALTMSIAGVANPDRLAMRVSEIVEAAIRKYVQRYGDKTKEPDPETGKPKVERHYKLQVTTPGSSPVLRLDVYGKAGHMGAVASCDGAITKAAFIMLALLQAGRTFAQIKAQGRFADAQGDLDPLVLEGGQGFVPTHDMEQVMQRMRQAAAQGVQDYCQFFGLAYKPEMSEMRFDKLHNNAFACPVDSPAMQSFRWAYQATNKPWPEAAGWQVSCDARIFARQGHNVVTFGPGNLKEAHSDSEYLDLRQMQEGLTLSALQAMRLAGAL